MRRRTKVWASAGVATLAAAAALVWRYPWFLDVARGARAIDSQCSGRVSIAGNVGGESIRERHCLTGFGATEQAYRGTDGGLYASFSLDTEYGARGRLLITGAGRAPRGAGVTAMSYALLRLPGTSERWFCASGGTIQLGADLREGSMTLTEVAALDVSAPDPTGGTLDWEETSGKRSFESHFASRTLRDVGTGGGSANPDYTRVEVRATLGVGEQSVRIVLAADEPMSAAGKDVPVASAFVVVQEHAWPTGRLSVAGAGPGGGSTARFGNLIKVESVHLRGLSDPKACPTEPRGAGQISIAWSR